MRTSIKRGDSVYIVFEDSYRRHDAEMASREVAAIFSSMKDAIEHRTELERMRGNASRFKIKSYTLDYHVGDKKGVHG